MADAYHEQVKLLLRVLPLVAEEKSFALKGGTAINLFERDLPRLSVDIDLCYLPFDDRATALANIDAALGRLKQRMESVIAGVTVTTVAQSEGNDAKLHCQFQRTQIKIEVNTTMRGQLFAPRLLPCSDAVQEEFEVFVEAQTVSKGELYGGKICAALDRQHPRDLFDVALLLNNEGLTPEIRQGFIAALLSHPRPIHEVLFSTYQNQRHIFDAQFAGMARLPFSYEDYEATRQRLRDALRAAMTEQDKTFLLSFKDGEPDWSLFDAANLSLMPAVQWKLVHIRKLKASNPAKHAAQFEALAERLRGE